MKGNSDIKLSIGIPLLGSLAKPFCSLDFVFWHAFSRHVNGSKKNLSIGIPLLGCLAKPFSSFGRIFWCAFSIKMVQSNII